MKAETIRESVTDHHLPQLPELLNANAMPSHFERELKLASSHQITDCQIIHVRYRPGRSCTVCYLLTVVDQMTGRSQHLTISLLACRPGESRAKFEEELAPSHVPAIAEAGVFHLPALEAIAWVFPRDRKLSGLPALMNPETLSRSLLPEVIKASRGAAWQIVNLASEVVSYVSERACTLRVNIELSDPRTETTDSLILYAKTYRADEGDRAWQCQRQLWQSESVKSGGLLMPHPFAYQPEIKTLWQDGLEGTVLIKYERLPLFGSSLLAKAGAAVATLHQTRLSGLPLITIDKVIARLTHAAELLSLVRPWCREKLDAVVQRLVAAAGLIGQRPAATLHGDLHLKNFLVNRDTIALIDLDDLSLGDPLLDVGSFVAALYYRGLVVDRSSQNTAEIARPFIAAWQAGSGEQESEAALAWHTAAALIDEQAYRYITRLKAESVVVFDEIIALAARFSARF